MSKKHLQPSVDKKDAEIQNWVLICYGNILRSQVLEQYLRHYAKLYNLQIDFYSAGIAKWDEFPNTKELLIEVRQELDKRDVSCSLQRNAWSNEVEDRIITADTVLCADTSVKNMVNNESTLLVKVKVN